MKLSKKAGVVALGFAVVTLSLFSSCQDKKNKVVADTKAPSVASENSVQKIAYVNLDSLEANYEFWSVKKAEFENRQKGMESEIERLTRNLQNEAAGFQKKAQAGTLTQAEGEAAQKKLGQMQQDLENKGQNMSAQMLKEQKDFNTELQTRLDEFLEKYNQDKKYAYILSYSKSGGMILYADPTLDITQDVVNGMNEEHKAKSKEKQADKSK